MLDVAADGPLGFAIAIAIAHVIVGLLRFDPPDRQTCHKCHLTLVPTVHRHAPGHIRRSLFSYPNLRC
jgi:hypothetical protein